MKNYPPTPEELRAWMDSKHLSSNDVADALHMKSGRTVRTWTATHDAVQIPFPSWYTLRHMFGAK